MKVKATIDSFEFIPSFYENLVRFNAVFAVEKGLKIDSKKFSNIEFDVPIVNELEKYSDDELRKELFRREKEFPKSFVFCSKCREPIHTKPVHIGGKNWYYYNHWYYCEHCNEIVLPIKD